MDGDFAVRNWALLLAASLAAVVCLFVAYHLFRQSAQARFGADHPDFGMLSFDNSSDRICSKLS